MQSTSMIAATEAVEKFVAAIKKDGEKFNNSEQYVESFLAATLRQICKHDESALAYVQRSTRFLETDPYKVVS